MPYKSIDELPDNFKDIPTKGKQIAMAAFNSAFSGTCKDQKDPEACAMKIAWSAIGNKFEKNKDGKWSEIQSAAKEYTAAEMKDMLSYMKSHRDMMDESMMKMMKSMMDNEDDDEMMSKKIISSIASRDPKPIRKGNKLIIPFVKVGTKAYDKSGKEYTLTEDALKNNFKSWENGIIKVNHEVQKAGKIEETWFDNQFVWGVHSGLSDELLSMVDTDAYMGTSQESIPIEVDDKGNVTSVKGTGNSFLFYPIKPACDSTMGCGTVTIASAVPPEPEQKRNCLCVFSKVLSDSIKGF